jgi:hypothetical protein
VDDGWHRVCALRRAKEAKLGIPFPTKLGGGEGEASYALYEGMPIDLRRDWYFPHLFLGRFFLIID